MHRLQAMNSSAWEALFFLLALKIPVVYLGVVVWRAIRDVPEPEEEAPVPAVLVPDTPPEAPAWSQRRPDRRPTRPRPGRHPSAPRKSSTRTLENR